MKNTKRLYRISNALYEKVRNNACRWCELVMKNGEVLTFIRTGYGPVEYPEMDDWELKRGEDVLIADKWWNCVQYINENY